MTLQPIWWLFALTAAALLAQLVLADRSGLRSTGLLRRCLVTALLAVVALQPVLGEQPRDATPSSADIVLVIDRTTSMGAQDVAGRSRMEAVARDVAELVRANPEARYAVITSDNVVRVAVPWTTDTRAVTAFAQSVGWREESIGSGTDIAAAGPLAQQLLADARALRPDASRHLVYFGDGEQTTDKAPGSFASLKPLLDGGLVLGYGSSDGGRMPLRPGAKEFVTRDGVVQLSRIDEVALRRLADEFGGQYEHRDGQGTLPTLSGGSATLTPATPIGGPQVGWVAALAAGLVAVCELWATVRAAALARREVVS